MNTFHLELTVTHKSGWVEHDFCIVEAQTREEAIAKHTAVLNKRMQPLPAEYPNSYAKWDSFKLA